MTKKSSFIVFLFAYGFSIVANAAGFENSSEVNLSELQKTVEMRRQQWVGRTLWGYFDRNKCRYPHSLAVQSTPTYMDPVRYSADGPKRLFVDGIVPSKTRGHENVFRYYRVKIEDGSTGFIDVSNLRLGDPEREESLRNDCLFALEPWDVQARLDKFSSDQSAKLAAEAEERKKADERVAQWEIDSLAKKQKQEAVARRPAARIGMTANQVIETTNWGAPKKINRIEAQSGVEEQWEYGLGTYLYFRNGRLTAIQD
jgi:hypothetical protein